MRHLAALTAGPLLGVASILIVLRQFAFSGGLTGLDVLRVWLPTYCYLGKTLAAGHIPGWNPYTLGGVPFAADPQSGWLYVTPMVLFASASCGTAIRWMVVVQPVLAGLGMFAFLRSEGLGRPAASVGCVAFGLAIATSGLTTSLPFAASLAWTAVTLAACSRFVRAETTPGRFLWCALTAMAWGQLAAAHFSVGLVIGTGAIAAYLAATAVELRQAPTWSGWRTAGWIGLLGGSLVCVNLAFLLPRLAYVPQTNLGQGYGQLQRLSSLLAGTKPMPLRIGYTARAGWPLKLATSPGTHLGAVALALAFGGFWSASKRLRGLAISFGVFGAISYLLSLGAVASRVPQGMRSFRAFDFYLHGPNWFGYGLILAIAVLAALGTEAWLEKHTWRTRIFMLSPGVLVWGLGASILTSRLGSVALLGIGAVVGGFLLALSVRRPWVGGGLALVLAGELVANAFLGSAATGFRGLPANLTRLPNATVDIGPYVQGGPISSALAATAARDGRFVPPLTPLGPVIVHGLLLNDGLLFRFESVAGYNPVQILRVWAFDRAVQHRAVRYNREIFTVLTPASLDLLQIGIEASRVQARPAGTRELVSGGGWAAFELPSAAPRASVFDSWTVLSAADGAAYPNVALAKLTGPSFDPSRVLLERHPDFGQGPGSASGTRVSLPATPPYAAGYVEEGPERATVTVHARTPSVLLIRNPWDPDWHATVDGRPVPLLRADYFLQAVAVGAGRHTVVLAYDDPWIRRGLIGSAASVALLLGVAGALRLLRHRRGQPAASQPPGSAHDMGT